MEENYPVTVLRWFDSEVGTNWISYLREGTYFCVTDFKKGRRYVFGEYLFIITGCNTVYNFYVSMM